MSAQRYRCYIANINKVAKRDPMKQANEDNIIQLANKFTNIMLQTHIHVIILKNNSFISYSLLNYAFHDLKRKILT